MITALLILAGIAIGLVLGFIAVSLVVNPLCWLVDTIFFGNPYKLSPWWWKNL